MAGLTKQHFESIAQIVKNNRFYNTTEEGIKPSNSIDLSGFIQNLADYFQTQNPLFNKNQFLKACLK